MDMFKLLARSTNLKKSTTARENASYQQIPSAGNHRQSDVNACDAVSAKGMQSCSSHGTKRKRHGNLKDGEIRVPQELDYFKVETERVTLPSNSIGKDIHALGSPAREYDRHGEDVVSQMPSLKAEDCRRLLKQHKLKITLFDIDIDSEGRPAKRGKNELRLHSQAWKKNTNTQLLPQPLTSFEELSSKYGISKRLAASLNSQGYSKPTEVQMGSLPVLLGSDDDRGLSQRRASGKKSRRSEIDLITVAPTGSGKTLAFLINVIHGLLEDRRKDGGLNKDREHTVEALIIVPTHELADQIVNETRKLTARVGLKVSRMRKGMVLHSELKTSGETSDLITSKDAEDEPSSSRPKLRARFLVKTAILVCTPLMLLHSISDSSASAPIPLPGVRYLVLDEADILLDPLFRTQTLGIWSACTNPALQTSLWSATIGSSIESLARSFILDRRRNLGIPSSSKDKIHHIVRLVVGLKDSAIPNISHRLIYAASEQGKLLALRQILHPPTASAGDSPSIQPPFLVFTQTIPRAVALHSELLYDISTEAGGSSRIAVLHADLSDTARSAIMEGFRKGEIWVLITTDLLSRGVDFRGVNGVVNYDIPNTSASYVHRVGRTGRQGRQGGIAVTFYTKEDIPYVKNIANIIAISERVNNTEDLTKSRPRMEKWLLDALPIVSKKTKQELKWKGVESRRSAAVGDDRARQARKTRISTKSGYERRMENRRKGAVAGSLRRAAIYEEDRSGGEEWGGIDD